MRRLRVLLLTEEDTLYLPLSINYILRNTVHDVVGVCCLRNPTTGSTVQTVRRFIGAFGVRPLLKHCARMVVPLLRDRVPFFNGTGRYYSVRRVAGAAGCPYHSVHDVNSEEFLSWAREVGPDLMISVSPTQIFRKMLLEIPRLGCLNVHSSLLPRFRGLYPVFWALAEGAEEIGVTIHYISEGVDAGDIVLQGTLSLEGISTMDQALVQAKSLGATLMVEAVKLVAEGKSERRIMDLSSGTYRSFPDKAAYKAFSGHGYRLW